MDEELPPPLPSDFEQDLDHSRCHGDEDEHESFGHLPLPEIDHNEMPDQNFVSPIIPKLENLNGMKIISPKIREQTPTKLCSEYIENSTDHTLKEYSNGGHFNEQQSNGCNEENVTTTVDEDMDAAGDFQEATNMKMKLGPPRSSPSIHQEKIPKESSPPPVPDDDEFDEFGDFAVTTEAEASTKILQQAAPVANIAKDEDDEWGEFDRAPRRDSHLTSNTSFDGEDDNFGAFGSSQPPEEKATSIGDDSWIPEFKESPQSADEDWEEDLLKKVEDIEWESGNEEETCFEEDHITEISSVLNASNNADINSPLRKSFELWCLLRIVEEAISLQYVFEGSTLASNHCKKINIDKSRVGKGGLAPISLDVLTPTPANVNVKPPDTLEVLTPSPILPEKEPSPTPSTSTVAFDSLSAPPAEFDWDKSGLTNPLKGTKGSSALLDVDFLSANTGASSSGAFTLQKDLAAFGLDVTEPAERKTSEKSILDTILSSTNPQTGYRPVSELSLDARALHDQLPDLSCLISTKVMLPFGGQ